ncbi:MAG TPA: M56 family metallopeptidase [Flavobacterium sp.]
MEALFIYILKSSALLAVFLTAYYLLLRKETFFRTNRWFLVSGVIASLTLPLYFIKKVVWVQRPQPAPAYTDTVSNTIIDNAATVMEHREPAVDWISIIGIAYVVIIALLLLKVGIEFFSLYRLLRNQKVERKKNLALVDINKNVAPFSFFNYIVYNSKLYNAAELENILNHEEVHSRQKHSLDILLAKLMCIAFWFNPLVWLYKKTMIQNLEYIADQEAIRKSNDKRAYQLALLKVVTHQNCFSITNNFYQSLIKKRIVMLNKNQSKKSNLWKYLLIFPALVAFMVYFQVKVIAQEKQQERISKTVQRSVEVVVDKNTSDAEMKSDAELLKKEHGVTLKFSKVRRNKQGEIIAIKAQFKDASGKKGVTQISGDEPIKPIRFYKNDNGAIGFNTGSTRTTVIAHNAPRHQEHEYSYHMDRNNDDIEMPEPPEAPEAPEAPETPGFHGKENVVITTTDVKSQVIVNGKVISGDKNKNVTVQTINGKTKVIVDGEIVSDIDTDRIIADMDPIIIDGVDVLRTGKNPRMAKVRINTREITRDAMRQAREGMARAKIEIERARPEMERAEREIERAGREMKLSKPEMERAKKEIEAAREELRKAKIEMEKTRAEMEKERAKEKK